MEFELTKEIIDQIIFGMENQEEDMVFDTVSGRLLGPEEAVQIDDPSEDRCLPLPVWRPLEGFQLMERFTGTLHNPVVRDALRSALGAGRGVFRNFKRIVKERPEIERLWFTFKDRELKQVVLDWYNGLAEIWGWLRRAGELSDYLEDTGELVMEDFTLEEISGRQDVLAEIDTAARGSVRTAAGTGIDTRGARRFAALSLPHIRAYRVLSPDGNTAGYIWGLGGSAAVVRALYVFKEFRGLGLSKELVKRFCDDALKDGCASVRINLPGKSLFMGPVLEEMGFTISRQVMKLPGHKARRETI